MDGLELLKKDWKKQEKNLPQYKSGELSPMLQKKSTSIVKWIFIISIIEFAFWIGLNLLTLSMDNDIADKTVELLKSPYMKALNYVSSIGIIGFIALFLRNYLKIKATDSVRLLLKRILETRKSVKYYVWFNLGISSVGFSIGFFSAAVNSGGISNDKLYFFLGFFAVFLGIFIGLLLLIYRLVYGRLTRRLLKNYKQFKKEEL